MWQPGGSPPRRGTARHHEAGRRLRDEQLARPPGPAQLRASLRSDGLKWVSASGPPGRRPRCLLPCLATGGTCDVTRGKTTRKLFFPPRARKRVYGSEQGTPRAKGVRGGCREPPPQDTHARWPGARPTKKVRAGPGASNFVSVGAAGREAARPKSGLTAVEPQGGGVTAGQARPCRGSVPLSGPSGLAVSSQWEKVGSPAGRPVGGRPRGATPACAQCGAMRAPRSRCAQSSTARASARATDVATASCRAARQSRQAGPPFSSRPAGHGMAL